MQAKKKRLTLDMDPAFQRRLKVTAALKGVSMRQYCLTAIDRELANDEVVHTPEETTRKPDHIGFAELRKELFGDRVFPGHSADLLREAREIRDAELEAATTGKKQPENFGIAGLITLRDEIFGDKVLPGNSADLLREARETRASEMEGWA